MKTSRWTREQTIVAFNLYCQIDFARASSKHPDIIRIAKIIGRSVNSVKMKIGNFGSFDPELKKRGIVGLANASKLDGEIWDEFNNNWNELAFESERLIAKFSKKTIEESTAISLDSLPEGKERNVMVKQRVNQGFFRKTVLAAHKSQCCITGLRVPQLLIASHIKPWSKCEDKKEKLNPRNGLCLNALHDKAFDVGLMTITPSFRVRLSSRLNDEYGDEVTSKFFKAYDGEEIIVPERFVPDVTFLEYHGDVVFE